MQLLTTKSCRPGGGVVLSKITDSNVRCWFWQTHPVLKLIWKNRTSFWENDQVREQFSHTFEKIQILKTFFSKNRKKYPVLDILKRRNRVFREVWAKIPTHIRNTSESLSYQLLPPPGRYPINYHFESFFDSFQWLCWMEFLKSLTIQLSQFSNERVKVFKTQ